jgi:hypothetical protein
VPLIILGIRAASASLPFIAMQPRLLAACKVCDTAPMDGASPYRRGSMLVVNRLGFTFGQVLADKRLGGIAATQSSKVGTIIRVGDPVAVQVGISPTGEKLYRSYRDVCLIDWSTKQVIFRTSLAGSAPTISG